MRGPARKGKISPTLHYVLTLLSQGPRLYNASFYKLVQLEKRGYVVLTGITAFDGSREWAITDAGLAALRAYTESEASLLMGPSIQFQEREVP